MARSPRLGPRNGRPAPEQALGVEEEGLGAVGGAPHAQVVHAPVVYTCRDNSLALEAPVRARIGVYVY